MKDVTIREAEQADCEALQELVAGLSAEQARLGERPVPEVVERAISYAFETGQPIWVAVGDGCLVGFCAWVALPEMPVGDVMGFGTYVAPAWRHAGVSTRLRIRAAAYWQARGASSVSGIVVEGNEAGLRSALAAGFRVVGHMVRKDFEHGQEELRQGQGDDEGRQGDGTEVLRMT